VSCHRARELLDPFIDGELDTAQADEFRRHLDECEGCKLAYDNQLALHTSLKNNESLYYRPTNDLRKRIRASLRQSLQTVTTVAVALF
jgi:anti-sigma factor (TIGR02949 family)